LFLGILAILFPPLPVWIRRGICSADSLINILLCMLGYLPGLIHAWYIIAITPSIYADHYHDLERGGREEHTTYWIIDDRNQQPAAPKPGTTPNYGTTSIEGPSQAPAPAAPATPVVANPAQISEGGEGSSGGAPPPTYADAVKGDHKIQSDD